MENTQRPELKELRQKRLAYFEQKCPAPTPPAKPKQSTGVDFTARKTPVDENFDRYHCNAAYNGTGTIPKVRQNNIQALDIPGRKETNSRSHDLGAASENGREFDNRLGSGDEEINRRPRSQELKRIESNEVRIDELFQSNCARQSSNRDRVVSKIDNRPTALISANNVASIDYKQRLSHDLRRTDHKKITDEISSSQISSGNSKGTRKENVLQRFLYKKDNADTSVLEASEHSARHAESILHQMREVRKLRQQVHGELVSGFSKRESKLGSADGKLRSEETCLSTDDDMFFRSELSCLEGDEKISPEPRNFVGDASCISSKIDGKSTSCDDKEFFSSHSKDDEVSRDREISTETDAKDYSDNDATFDLGALQDAVKQGDDTLRKYIQSLSRNIKRKKLRESAVMLQNTRVTDKQGDSFTENLSDSTDVASSRLRHGTARPCDKLNAGFSRARKEQQKLSQAEIKGKEFYTPKVSMPAITSDELESLGFFSERHRNPLKRNENPLTKRDATFNNFTQKDELNLQTHRPRERPPSPLTLVYVRNENNQELTDSCVLEDDSYNRLAHSESSSSKSDLDLRTHIGDPIQDTKSARTVGTLSCGRENSVSVDSDNSRSSENQSSNSASSDIIQRRPPPPSYGQLFSEPEAWDPGSVPFSHPLGTEIRQNLCSERSTDSDDNYDFEKRSSLKPNPPKQKKSTAPQNSRRKLHALAPDSPKTSKTSERHVDAVREHHEREREIKKQVSPRKAQNKQSNDKTCKTKSSANEPSKHLEKGAVNSEANTLNGFSQDIDKLKHDALKGFLNNSQPQEIVKEFPGPSGDFNQNLVSPKKAAKICPNCDSFNIHSLSECEICGADISDLPLEPVDLEVPVFGAHFEDLAGGDSVRNHVTDESAEDFEQSVLVRGDSNISNEKDSDSIIMTKIANFVPKLSAKGDFKRIKIPKTRLQESGLRRNEENRKLGNLPERVDAWLAENNTSRLLGPNPSHRNFESSVSYDTEQKVEVSPQANPKHQEMQQSRKTRKLKPRPASSGPQQSKQSTSKTRSKTSQLIDRPMFNRRWATSSSTWGSRRSENDFLDVPSQKSGVLDSVLSSGSLNSQKKRPSSAKLDARPQKSNGDPKFREKSRPKSALAKSKDLNVRREGSNFKDEFLAVSSAHVEEGITSKALNCSHSVLPLTLQLISDSPRSDDRLSVWELLPDEILLGIFSHLSYEDLVNCAATCLRFYRIAMDDALWRTIRLHKRQLSDFSLTQIGDRHPVYLSFTQCRGNIVTENGLRNLFRSCAETLQELNVSGCTGGELTGDSLLLHASRCKHLTSLDASWCQVTDNGLTAISESCQRLTSLCLNGCQSVSDECLSNVVQKHGKSLQVFEVLGCLQLSPKTLQLLGTKCRQLHTLNIGQCYKITDDCVSEVVCLLRNLKHLDLRGCKQIRDSCIRKIVRNCKRLETLILANCAHVTNAAIVEIATYLPSIRSLDVSSCKKVTNEGIRSLAVCCHNLQSLNISSTNVDTKSVSALANYCNKTLLSLHLNCCKDITETVIMKLLKNCKKLQTLHVYGVKGLRNLNAMKLQYPCLQFE